MAEKLDGAGGLPEFDTNGDPSTLSQRWKRWKRALGLYIAARGIDKDARKVAMLLHAGGMNLQDIYFALVGEGTEKPYAEAVKILDDHFTPQANVPFERHLFHKMEQASGETVDQFVCRLRQKAATCEFTETNEAIRDQLIDGCRDIALRKKFLEKTGVVDLKSLTDIARAHEAVEQQLRQMSLHESTAAPGRVNALAKQKPPRSAKKPTKEKHSNSQRCYRCNKPGHFGRDESCPARGTTCRKCGGKDHYEVCCRSRKKIGKSPQVKAVAPEHDDSDSSEGYAFRISDSERRRNNLEVSIGNVSAHIIVDSGASVNVVGRDTWQDLKRQKVKCTSSASHREIYSYGAKDPLPTLGTFKANVKAGVREAECEFVVVDCKAETLLSRESSEALGLLKIGYDVNAVEATCDDTYCKEILQKYPGIGDGVGKRTDRQVSLHIDRDVTPAAQPLRRVAYSQKTKVESKIWKLLDDDIIEPASGPTSWVNPVVVVPKPDGDIRLCIDMRRANEAIVRERHPIPTAEEVLQEMAGAEVFSKIDLKWGYHQLELSPDSRDITTFVTHVGLFRFKRLMFGINAASELYQHEINKIIQGIPGVRNISDDIAICGKTRAEHDERLHETLRRLHSAGLTINMDKCAFGVSKMTFFGYSVSNKGVDIEDQKVKAIREAREPESASEVRSFLGLVNFVARFIPDLSTTAEPLRQLTRHDVPFMFGEKERTAFVKLKEAISSANTLGFYDPKAKTSVIADASPVGLGAVLVQEGECGPRIISYASRSLSDVERRYSQTEREALALVWACEKFHLYVYGIEFDLVTDHKPLQAIYSPRSKPCARVERWVLRLQPYTYRVVHIPGKQNIADTLSRLLAHGSTSAGNLGRAAERYVRFVARVSTPAAMTTREVEEASREDPELAAVRDCLESGHWDQCPYKDYIPIHNELCKIGYLVLRGTRIVMPQKLRSRALALAHEGHLGVVGTKQALRSKVWWPKMYLDAEKYCRACHGCQTVAKPSPPEPLRPTELPPGPWQDVAVDFLGPLPTGESILVVIDYYSRYYETKIMKSITTERTIIALQEIFSRHGLPQTLKSDNGRQLVSEEFENYLEQLGIEHARVTPKWAQANGEVERQNQSILKRLRIAHAEGRDWRKELQTYLLAYRTTPHATTGASPARLLFGRELRTKLPHLTAIPDDQEIRDRDAEKKGSAKLYADHKRRAEHSDTRPGDEVLVRIEQRHDKLETTFHPEPYRVVARKGNQVTVQSPAGVRYKRNVTAIKRFHRAPEDRVGAVPRMDLRDPPTMEPPCTLPEQVAELAPPTPVPPEPAPAVAPVAAPSAAAADSNRPSRAAGTPIRFRDYVMS